MKNFVITIARGYGSGGHEIGVKLGEVFGIPCYEKQILDMASEYSGINKDLFLQADEKLSFGKITAALRGMPRTTMVEPNCRDFVSDVNIFNIQAHIIRQLAENESCVIVGKCGSYILRNFDNVVSVYIEAPRENCVASTIEKLGVSEAEAHRIITKTDRTRALYYEYFCEGGDWMLPTNYDMTLNTGRIPKDHCVEIIRDYVNYKFGDNK
ncbi:MAG: cytidylate kinase-like family protein [Firmicutes bacterium]|nr:cytidylate kinase-like family protein [Bacillota bacterium]